ncbi:MAG: hypothetical protein GX488_01785, partial [Clostridiales bacterium]|nr:hypothetical protein [Clostridiales bacterium]
DPSIFIEKYFSYKDLSSASEGEPKKILLQNNFRSDVNILSACNHVFSNIMSKSLGEIDYDGSAALFPPENAKPPRGKTCLTILSVPQADDGEDRPDKTLLEARMVAKRIRSLVESGETILENDKERPIEYGDIAVLLRSPNSAGSAFRRAFAEQGVPVLAEQGGGFFTAPEILIVRSLLSVIDNPHRDISLAAVLSSPVFGFSPDELSLIRTFDRENDFYTALLNAAQENKKCAEFLESLSELRAISSDIGVYELLCLIYERFDLPALFAAADGLGLFPPNLSLLLDCAAKFEENGYRGLYSFINYLKRMEDRGEEPAGTAEHTGSAVSVMSIHKSKGLEFPVVFLADTSRKFNTNDTRSRVLIHPELGLGCKITDINRGIEYPTLARRAISSRLSSEMLSEEMRVLYVAMTRAKERLYISCTSKDPPSLISKLSENLTSPLSPEILKEAPSMSYWLISAALIDSGGLIDMNIAVPESEETSKPLDEGHSCTALCIDESKLSEIRKILEYKYPFEKSIHLPTKLTATSLPSEELYNESQPIVREYPKVFRLPDFSVSEKPLSGTERGTATHIVMQFIDFSRTGTLDEVESEIMRIKELGHLTDRQAEAVDRQSVFRFFSSEIGRRIKAADRVYREMRFSLLCPAEKFFPDSKGEQILLQGVVDCCIEESGLLTVIDYKTDFVSEDTLSELAEHYRKQISAYAYAMSKVLGKPVRSCLLCFLRAGLSAEIFPDIY